MNQSASCSFSEALRLRLLDPRDPLTQNRCCQISNIKTTRGHGSPLRPPKQQRTVSVPGSTRESISPKHLRYIIPILMFYTLFTPAVQRVCLQENNDPRVNCELITLNIKQNIGLCYSHQTKAEADNFRPLHPFTQICFHLH